MKEDDKIEPTGPEEGDEQFPECEGCGERHPPMPEGLAEAIQGSFKAFVERRQQDQDRNQSMFFNLASIAMPELARTVGVRPDDAEVMAKAMRTAILTLLDMTASKEEEESGVHIIPLGEFPKGPMQ